MSWSYKILALYLGFVGLILTLVFTCFGHKTELEYSDYYSRELKFQQQIIAQENANKLSEPIDYKITNGNIELSFPAEILSGLAGTIELLRPSDATMDRSVLVAPDGQGHQKVTGLSKGLYKMRVSLEQNNINYFKEAVINIR